MTGVEPTVVETPRGQVEIAWGVNRWVLVTTPDDEPIEAQVAREHELASLLPEAGLSREAAAAAARRAWRSRPPDARMPNVHAAESAWRATGLPPLAILFVLAVFVALALYALVHLARTRGTNRPPPPG